MSLPAMLVGETVGEIYKASQFAREIVSAVSRKLPRGKSSWCIMLDPSKHVVRLLHS